jgi:hypothetical protein
MIVCTDGEPHGQYGAGPGQDGRMHAAAQIPQLLARGIQLAAGLAHIGV